MKKENVVRKILVSSIVGFPIGVTLLMIAYIGVYYIAGENVFIAEISQLQNIQTLISQIIFLGLSYYIVFVCFHVFSHLNNKELNDKYMTKHPYKSVSIALLSSLGFIVATTLVSIEKIFTENLATMNIIVLVVLYAICGLFFLIKCTIESNLIKKINAKIQERNK